MLNIVWGMTGLLALLAVAYLFSTDRKAIKWKTIGLGLALQLSFAFVVLESPIGKKALLAVSDVVGTVMGYANNGINFLFGGIFSAEGVGFVFALQVLASIIFFSALVSVLYYFGVMQFVVKIIGGLLEKVLGTSKAESFNAAANIFLGQTEAPLLIRPYLKKMTESELFAVMVGGLASVAGSVLVGYAAMGIPIEHLLAAAVMAAPGALIMAKLLIPETKKVEKQDVKLAKSDAVNVFDAASRGAADGLQLALSVGAMLLAFIALVAMLNGGVGFIGGLLGIDGLTIETILGYVFAPIAFLIGVPWEEAVRAGSFIGQKLVLNEFVAFSNLGPVLDTFTPKTQAIVAFALTGFANFSCIAILIGGIGMMAPERRNDIARLGMKAVLAATLANLMSAAIAGMFM